jgi:serine/threonine protein kinase
MSLSMGEEKRPLDEDLSRDYFRQIILAIEYLHCNGIVSFPVPSTTRTIY